MNELTLPERAAVALGDSANAAKLKLLAAASANILAVTNLDGRTEAHRAGMVLRNTRTAIASTGKAAREDATAFSKAVIALERDLIAIIEPEEIRVLGLRDGFDAAEQARKDALIAAERARTDEIKLRISMIRAKPLAATGKPSAEISVMIGELAGVQSFEIYEEFADEAKAARLETLDLLAKAETAQRGIEIEAESQRQQLAREKLEREEEVERLAAERLAIQQERDAMAERAAEQDRIAKVARDAAQAELKAAQDKFNAEQAEARAETARQAAEAQRVIDESARVQREAVDAEEKRITEIHAAEELESRPTMPAQFNPEPFPFPQAVPVTPPTLTLGKIGTRIAPLSITAGGLSILGFEPADRKGAAMLYHESDFPAMCDAMIGYIEKARTPQQIAV